MVLVQLFCCSQFQWYWMSCPLCTLQQSTALIFQFQLTKGSRQMGSVKLSSLCFWTLFLGRLCGALADMLIRSEAVDQIKNAIMLHSLISAASKWIQVLQSIISRSNAQFRVSRLKRSMRSGGVSELAETGSRTEDLCSHLSPSQSSLFLQCNSVSAVDRIRVRKSRLWGVAIILQPLSILRRFYAYSDWVDTILRHFIWRTVIIKLCSRRRRRLHLSCRCEHDW